MSLPAPTAPRAPDDDAMLAGDDLVGAAVPASVSHPCANCGAPAPRRYCPECGQSTADRVVSLRELLGELASEISGWDSKVARTLVALVRRPGLLTREYVAGRRASYVRPLRLYLSLSVLFFLALQLPGAGLPQILKARQTTTSNSTTQATTPDPSDAEDAAARAQRRADLEKGLAEAGNWFERRAIERQLQFDRMSSRERGDFFREGFAHHLPNAMFLLLPAFAAVLKLVYARRGRLYAEHFVFALHVHAAAFALLTLAVFWDDTTARIGVWAAWVVYLFVAMRRNYGQSRRKTALKLALLMSAYLPLLLVGALGVLLAAFFLE